MSWKCKTCGQLNAEETTKCVSCTISRQENENVVVAPPKINTGRQPVPPKWGGNQKQVDNSLLEDMLKWVAVMLGVCILFSGLFVLSESFAIGLSYLAGGFVSVLLLLAAAKALSLLGEIARNTKK